MHASPTAREDTATEDAKAAILKDGVFLFGDPDVGRRVYEFDKKGFPFQTEDGLDFCQTSTLDNTCVRNVVQSFFERSGLGLLKAFGPRPSSVFSFLNNIADEVNKETDNVNKRRDAVRILVVQLLSSNSQMVFYRGSHLHSLKAKPAKVGLLDVPQESLGRGDIRPLEVNMKDGGIAIIDGRIAFEMVRGVTIMVGFAIEEELKFWRKMRLPKTASLIRKVKEMESETIGMNVEFIDLDLEQDTSIANTTQST